VNKFNSYGRSSDQAQSSAQWAGLYLHPWCEEAGCLFESRSLPVTSQTSLYQRPR